MIKNITRPSKFRVLIRSPKVPALLLVFLLIVMLTASQSAFAKINTPEETDVIAPVEISDDETEVSPDIDPETISKEKEELTDDSTPATLPFNPNQISNIIRPEVDQTTGALTYNYSFDLPKGINNLTPDLSLRYNSQDTRKDSVLGYGWTFNIPYIVRETTQGTDKTYDNNNFVSSFDGELTAINGNLFGPKSDDGSMRKYIFSNNSFSFSDKSGTVYTYGANSNSRQDDPDNASHVFKWMLSSVADSNGNIISYTYFKNQGQIYPETVSYNQGGNNILVEFERATRPNGNNLYTPAFKVRTLERISNVNIWIGGVLIKKYTISTAGNLIKNIRVKGYKDNEEPLILPPVQFDYAFEEGTKEWSIDSGFELPEFNGQVITLDYNYNSQYGNSFLDINGDGLPDIVRWIAGQSNGYASQTYGNQVFLNTGSGFELDSSFELPTVNGKVVTLNYNNGSLSGNSFFDVNGDGLPDVVRWTRGQLNGYASLDSKSGNQVFLNTGTNFELASGFSLPVDANNKVVTLDYNNMGLYGNSFRDINGDDLPDIIRWTQDQPNGYASSDSKNGNQVFLNMGSSFELASNFSLPTDGSGKVLTLDYNYNAIYGNSFRDINGDDLPDIIRWTNTESNGFSSLPYGNEVFLNTGSGFELTSDFSLPTHTNGKVLTLDYNYNATYGNSFRDINGDGLLDIVRWIAAQPNGYASLTSGNQVFLNTGSGFELDSNFLLPTDGSGDVVTLDYSYLSSTESYGNFFRDINGDNLPDVVRWTRSQPNGYASQTYGNQVFLNTGADFEPDPEFLFPTINGLVPALDLNLASQYGNSFRDLNGDGLPDIIRWRTGYPNGYSSLPNGNQVFLNKIGRMEIEEITDSLGGTHTFLFKGIREFTDSENVGINADIPENYESFVVFSSSANDHNGNIGTTFYEYQKASYYFNTFFSKKFAGFEKTTLTLPDGNKEIIYYHAGNESDDESFEYNDHVSKIGKIYRSEIKNSSGTLLTSVTSKYEKNQLASLEGNRYFVYPIQIVSEMFSGTAKATASTNEFNLTTGNLVTQINWGEVIANNSLVFTDTGTDKRTINYTYANNGDEMYFLAQETLLDQDLLVSSEIRHYYDNQILGVLIKGNETKTEKLKLPGIYVSTQNSYDSYGNVISHTDENGKITTYTIDSFHLYPISVASPVFPLGGVITTSTTYDYLVGKPLTITDSNGFITEYSYDAFGRILKVKIPDPASSLPTAPRVLQKTFSYVDTPNAISVSETNFLSLTLFSKSFSYFDSFGRKIQTRISTEGLEWKVSDTIYDNMGRISKISVPYFSLGTARTLPTVLSYQLITNAYDALSRPISVANILGTTFFSYSGFTKTVTDPNGKIKDFTTDSYENLIQVVEHNGATLYQTNYVYNANNNLKKITDALGNIREFTYDNLGRRLIAQDLHAPLDLTFGTWTYVYDDVGNLIQSKSPSNQIVNYTYDVINRRLTEDFTGTSGTEITYSYDTAGNNLCLNGVGKLCSVIMTSGTTNYTYNSNGNIASETKIIDLNNTYATSYVYDYLGNISKIVYPDNAEVKYTYNSAGLLEKIERKELNGTLVNVISNFDYSPMDQITKIVFPNSVVVTNTYDATKLYRLTQKFARNIASLKLQDLKYTYDKVGNIVKIIDASNTATAKTIDYLYDDLYRLTSATVSGAVNGKNYTEIFTYDAIGNILTKSNQNGQETYLYAGTNYANPHAVTSIRNSPNYAFDFTYDQNGNLTKKISSTFAILSGSVNPNGANTMAWYESSATGSQKLQYGPLPLLPYTLTGLKPNTDYSFKVVANNKNGTTEENRIFTTAGGKPSILSINAIPGKYEAELTGTVNPNGSSTDAWFTFSSLSGTQTQSTVTHIANCNEPTPLPPFLLKGLRPNTSYTFNLVAKNEVGTTSYAITFRTKKLLSEKEPPEISSVGVTLNTPLSLFNDSNYNWNYKNELIGVSGKSNVDIYAYDHNSNRVKAFVNGTTTYYPNKFYDTSGIKKTKYIYAGNTLVATIKTVGAVVTPTYVHTDHLNSTSVISNGGGAIAQAIDYYPYGAERTCSGTSCDAKKKYIGQYSDTDTALDYLNARYYDSSRGQFISQDPAFWKIGSSQFEEDYNITLQYYLMNPQSLNSYSYANNNPVTWSDPDGEILPIIAAGILVVTIGFVIWDSYDVYVAFNDPNSTDSQKAWAVGALALNAVPGVGPVKGTIKGAKVVSRGIKIMKAGEEWAKIYKGTNQVGRLLMEGVEHNKVLTLIRDNYRAGSQIGASTADAIEHFLKTGELVKGSNHLIKAQNSLNRIANIINDTSLKLNEKEVEVLNKISSELKSVLDQLIK